MHLGACGGRGQWVWLLTNPGRLWGQEFTSWVFVQFRVVMGVGVSRAQAPRVWGAWGVGFGDSAAVAIWRPQDLTAWDLGMSRRVGVGWDARSLEQPPLPPPAPAGSP